MVSREQLCAVQFVAFDFDGVFTDNTVCVDQNGVESVRCWRSDGLGLAMLKQAGIHVMIVSTETNPVVTARARKLQVPCKQSVADKAQAVRAACDELGVDPRNAMFVGNDINDIAAFGAVGLPVAVADAYPAVFPHVVFRTERPGGRGAVREICDMLVDARQTLK